MTHEEFDKLVDRRCGLIKQVLKSKSQEYSTGEDRLHNFRKAAEFLRESPTEACLAFMTKHLVSIVDIVKSGKFTQSLVDEKVGDAINYLILLEGLLAEQLEIDNHIKKSKHSATNWSQGVPEFITGMEGHS